jgi:hypothetical protein
MFIAPLTVCVVPILGNPLAARKRSRSHRTELYLLESSESKQDLGKESYIAGCTGNDGSRIWWLERILGEDSRGEYGFLIRRGGG